MKSATLLRISAMLSLSLVSACQSVPVINRPASSCGSLVPGEWRDGVQSATLPGLASGLVDWQVFGVNQTAQLDKANSRTRDGMDIVSKCEARDLATVKALTRPFWAFWR